MRERIVRIGELVEDHALALVAHFLGQVARAFHAARLRREHDLGAERAHRLAPLDRQVLGHDQHHAVAAHRRRHRERDAGVAAGGSISVSPGLIVAALLGAHDIDSAGRSLTEPAGLLPSSLARITLPLLSFRAGDALAGAPAAYCR